MSEIVATREFRPSLPRIVQTMMQDSRSQGNAWFRWWLLILTVGFIAWAAFELFSTGSLRVLEGIAVVLAATTLGWFILIWAMPRLVEKVPHNRSAFTPRRYKFNADTLFLETADGVSLKVPYRVFSRISLGPDWILFYESFPGFAAHAIPCEAFESKAQENAVRGWLAVYAK